MFITTSIILLVLNYPFTNEFMLIVYKNDLVFYNFSVFVIMFVFIYLYVSTRTIQEESMSNSMVFTYSSFFHKFRNLNIFIRFNRYMT